jgi:hypothetical protein
MARRNPSNPRYQKDGKLGSTRKSAAAAKPKRSAGERGPLSGDGKPKRRFEQIVNDDIKQARRRWWIFILAALAAAAVLLIPQVQENRTLTSLGMGVWGACFFTALYIEFFVIRKLRKSEIEKRKTERKKK